MDEGSCMNGPSGRGGLAGSYAISHAWSMPRMVLRSFQFTQYQAHKISNMLCLPQVRFVFKEIQPASNDHTVASDEACQKSRHMYD